MRSSLSQLADIKHKMIKKSQSMVQFEFVQELQVIFVLKTVF